MAILDKRGRIVIPAEARKRVDLKAGGRVVIRVRDDGVVEVVPLDKFFEEVSRVFEEKLKDW